MSLLSEERKKAIIEDLNRNGKVKVVDLAEQFQVSAETIRRDLALLEEEGCLKRVYGGAVKSAYQSGEPPFMQRQNVHIEAKAAIGKAAAKLINDGDTIVIDVGTTTVEFARALENKHDLTILTNSMPVASVLTESLNQQLFTGHLLFLGGQINPKQQSTTGRLTEKTLEQFHIDKAFISAGGISLNSGVSDYDLEECLVSQAMIAVSKQTIVLADYSKMGINAFCKICPFDQIDVIVSDQEAPLSWKNELETKEIQWISSAKK